LTKFYRAQNCYCRPYPSYEL